MLGADSSLQTFVNCIWLSENPQLTLTFTRDYILCLKGRPKIRAVGNTVDAGIWGHGGEHQSLV